MRPLSPIDDRDLAMLLQIRHFEQALLEAFARGGVHGTTHPCIGQECVAVALSSLLIEDDFQLSNHRGHGHYLARFNDLRGLLAEIMGREGAICNGFGGSQHLHRRRQFVSTGVQGESLPVAVGAAFHFKRHHPRAIAVAHVGDGTWGQGAVYEALNIASLWQLPLLVAVENNRIAQTTPIEEHLAGDVQRRAAAFDIAYLRIETDDIADIRACLRTPFEQLRRQRIPWIVEFDTLRVGPHSKGDDTRAPQELAKISAMDWYVRFRQSYGDQFARLDAAASSDVARVFAEVAGRPLSSWSSGG